jgi:galactose oxidase
MARYISVRSTLRLIGKGAKSLLLIASTSILATLPGLAEAQTPGIIGLAGTSLCADDSSQSLSTGNPIITWTCNGGTNQNWQPSATGTLYKFINQLSNLCMDVSGASTAAGAPVIQWTCNGGANQAFSAQAQGSGYALVASHSGMCLAAASLTATGPQITQQVCNGSAQQTWQVAGLKVASLPSKWTAPIKLPIIPVAAANLTDGTVLVWSADSALNFTPGEVTPGKTYTAIFNPTTQTSKQVIETNTGHDMFCPGIVNLPDGRIYVTGGSSSDLTSLYTPSTQKWAVGDKMNIPRAYQGSVTLSNGNVFLVGGSWNGPLGGKTGETWIPGSGWQLNGAITDNYILTNDAGGIFRADNHAWLFAVSNGQVFHAGPSQAMHWFDTSGNGSVTAAGVRGSDSDAMNGNAVMFDIGKILAVGGAPSYDSSNATSNATLITIGNGTATTQTLPSMSYQRAFNNSVVLPNGQVVVIGGQTFAQPFSDDTAILTPELWDPTKQTFTPLAPQAVPRVYHSIALLLPDGRVLSGGGGLCGSCSTNHPNVEILTPPYLLNANGSAATRPTISSAPTTAQLGTTIAVSASSGIQAFALMRFSSVTHSVNNEQRRIPVSFTVGTGGEYLLTIPSDPGVVVPGYYMLFALNANGVPSVSRTVQIP